MCSHVDYCVPLERMPSLLLWLTQEHIPTISDVEPPAVPRERDIAIKIAHGQHALNVVAERADCCLASSWPMVCPFESPPDWQRTKPNERSNAQCRRKHQHTRAKLVDEHPEQQWRGRRCYTSWHTQ
jgi:hypothetical protein